MPPTRQKSSSKRRALPAKGIQAVPWAMLARAGTVLSKRWTSLSEKERARLRSLLGASRGRVGNLSQRERAEVRKLVGKLDLSGAARELRSLRRGGGRLRKRG